MKPELEEILQHHGVKGMHWGERRDNHNLGTTAKERNALGKRIDSVKREHSWKKNLKNLDNMSTQDIQKLSSRIQLENDLKRLSKSKKILHPFIPTISTKKDREDYLRRAGMSDQELARKVHRLRVKENLLRTTRDATKEQREFGKKIVTTAATVGVKYAITGGVTPGDIAAATMMHPNAAQAKIKQDVTKSVVDGISKKHKQPKS